MRGGLVVVSALALALGACGKSARRERRDSAKRDVRDPVARSFHLIEPIARHLELARESPAALVRTNASYPSNDGAVVIGTSVLSLSLDGGDEEPIRWTPATGTVPLGALPGVNSDTDTTGIGAVNPSATVVVGSATDATGKVCAFRWTEATDLVDISPPNAIEARATLVSDDGAAAAGWYSILGSGEMGLFRWTSETGAEDLGMIPGGGSGEPMFLSADGSVIAGIATPSCAVLGQCPNRNTFFEWTSESGMKDLGTLAGNDICSVMFPNELSYGPLMTGYCTGGGRYEPFIWSEEDGLRGLGPLPVSDEGWPVAVSEDGRTAILQSRIQDGVIAAWRWTEDAGLRNILSSDRDGPFQFQSLRSSMSADGAVVVGRIDRNDGPKAFRFTSRGLEELPTLPNRTSSAAYGVSRDGSTIAGTSTSSTVDDPVAVVWRGDRIDRIDELLATRGIELEADVRLSFAAATPSANVLVGDADTPRGKLAWILTLEE
jgi:uncharacterized membrane protein